MELSTNALCFKCLRTGEVFIYGDQFANPLFYSPDGAKFYELKQTGFGGTSIKHSVHFDDPHHNRSGQFELDEGTLTWNGKVFKLTETPPEINPIPLPTVREAEYLFRLDDGTYIYVSHDKYKYGYETFKLFAGPADHLEEIPINNVERYRDGGTTYVKTDKGTLFSPTPFDKKAKPTWDGEKVKELDLKKFLIEENGNTAKITKK